MTRIPRSCALVPLLAVLAACGADGPTGLKLHTTTSTVMQGGSGIAITATGGRKGDNVSWRLLPGSTGTLTPSTDTRSAIYFPDAASGTGTLSIEAKLRSDTETLALQLQPSPASELLATLPAWWQSVRDAASGNSGINGEPRGLAADGSGGYYVSYAAPTSKVVQVKTGGTVVEVPALAGYGIIGGTKDGTLYLWREAANSALTVSKRTPDGKISVLTRTAAYDGKRATIDGPSGTATAFYPRFAVDAAGNLYAADGSKVRKIGADGSWSTLAGDGCGMGDAAKCPTYPVAGKGSAARLGQTVAIASSADGTLYASVGTAIVKVTQAGEATVLAGADGSLMSSMVDGAGGDARFHMVVTMSVNTAGNIYALDKYSIRRITPSGAVSTVATGVGTLQVDQAEQWVKQLRANDNGTIDYLRIGDLRRVKVQ